MSIRSRLAAILHPEFDDYDFHPDDDLMDSALPLVATGSRIPFDQIFEGQQFKINWEPGWRTRGAAVMAPVGVLNHWTAGRPTTQRPAPSRIICRDGRPATRKVSGIPGPLVQLLIGYDGTVHVLASGRANHAGKGHAALITEIRANKLPQLSAAKRRLPDTGGAGGALIGIELEHSGAVGAMMPTVQVTAWLQCLAAIATHYSWHPNRVSWDHALWTARKIDFTTGRMAPWTSRAWLAQSVASHMHTT